MRLVSYVSINCRCCNARAPLHSSTPGSHTRPNHSQLHIESCHHALEVPEKMPDKQKRTNLKRLKNMVRTSDMSNTVDINTPHYKLLSIQIVIRAPCRTLLRQIACTERCLPETRSVATALHHGYTTGTTASLLSIAPPKPTGITSTLEKITIEVSQTRKIHENFRHEYLGASSISVFRSTAGRARHSTALNAGAGTSSWEVSSFANTALRKARFEQVEAAQSTAQHPRRFIIVQNNR